MSRWSAVCAAVVAVLVLWAGGAPGQGKPDCDLRGNVSTPQKVEGQVVKIDAGQTRVTVREADGKDYEFTASKETLETLKVGDHIKATLRSAPRC